MNEKNVRSIPELFGSMVFSQAQMRQRLPERVYDAWQQCLIQGTSLDRSIADEIAAAMKDWAIEKGATHYTHWFQPMTGFTAEKHDSFIAPNVPGTILMELSGKELSRGTFSACRSAMACIMAAHSSSVTDTPYFLAHTRTRSTGTIMVTRFLYPSFSGVPLR